MKRIEMKNVPKSSALIDQIRKDTIECEVQQFYHETRSEVLSNNFHKLEGRKKVCKS